MRAGCVVTVEPGLYYPGIGGVRLEDDVLITQDGCENLCTLGNEFEI
ncbi:MAG: M24 family metallopeptidase [Planctomycetota bacterium]